MTRPRKALSDVGGPVRTAGDRAAAAILRRAFAAAEDEDPDTLTHGFHAYPARMHPAIARTLVRELASAGDVVIDPFCGSGTVIVESMIAAQRAVGVDLSPLAIRVAEVKCELRDERARGRFVTTLEAVGERSTERVKKRAYAHAKLPRHELSWWDPHVLKELAGLREEITAVEDERDRRALEVLLSAIVVKFSRQRADTAEREAPKRIRKGLATEFFVRRGRELAERWAALREAAPKQAKRPKLFEDDARALARIVPQRVRARLIVTSPPYGGTYDYVQHHARRYAWLGLDPRRLERDEIGARRNLDAEDAVARWDRELGDALRAMARVTQRGAPIVLLIGDARIGRRTIDAKDQVRALATDLGLRAVAAASQARRHDRQEHLLWLSVF